MKLIHKSLASLLVFLMLVSPLVQAFAQTADDPVTPPPVDNPTSPPPPNPPDTVTPTDPPVTDPAPTDLPSETDPETSPEKIAAAQGDPDAVVISQNLAYQKTAQPKADGATGALTYDYPLQTPPGRNGLGPDLKLSYNSQNQEDGSIFGYGWKVNIPYIERINKDGTNNLYTENYFHSSIDGELVPQGNGNFTPKTESGNFSNYSFGNDYWLVTDKQGTTYKFGYSPSARQDDTNNSAKIYKWMLEETKDANDNTVSYSYFKDQGQIYPDVISYGGIYSINFLRTTRQDIYRGYRTAFSVTSGYVISAVQVKVNGNISKSYLLTYSNNTTTKRSRLQSVAIEDGTHAFPPTTFDYQVESAKGFSDNWSSPAVPVGLKSGVIPADVNGDGYPDFVQAYEYNYVNYTSLKSVPLYNPQANNWLQGGWNVPPGIMIYTDNAFLPHWAGTSVVDFNGDLKPDFIRVDIYSGAVDQELNNGNVLNDGNAWTKTNDWLSNVPSNGATRITTDLNGDGLTDVFGTHYSFPNYATVSSLNTGQTFNNDAGSFNSPENLGNVLTVDVNADGLPDLVKSNWTYGNPNGGTWDKKIYLNNGNWWVEDPSWTFPDICYHCQGSGGGSDRAIYFQDFNNDGYVDFLIDQVVVIINQHVSSTVIYINNGHGWTEDTGWYSNAHVESANCFCQNPGLFLDGNADGSPDVYTSNQGSGPISTQIFENKNHNQVDLLSSITLPTGGTVSVQYKASTQYRDGTGNLLNPKLPLIIQTVEKIVTDDKNGNVSTATYSYKDGSYFYNGPFDRKFAGFNKVTETDSAGNATTTFYHQGNASDASQGEYNDDEWKIGKPYRIEISNSSGNIYSKTINKWNDSDLGNGSKFVKLAQTVDFTYDGDSTHKDKVTSYTYDNTNGNVTQKKEYGEVAGNDDGSFADAGTDDFTTNYTYASSNHISLPSDVITSDHNGTNVKETRYYYDTLPLGQIVKGNQTKEENWKSGTSYINTQKSYNAYGLVTDSTDANGNTTHYIYDSFNLYPATITNPLNQTTNLTYDYASGQVAQKTDPNSRVFQYTYDGLGRLLSEKQPDLTSPSSLVTKTSYVYTDTPNNLSIQKSDYLDNGTITDSYVYFDGLGRKVQERREAEIGYNVKDYIYNTLGLLDKESLPYFSSGSARTTPTEASGLYTSYTYDPMQRVVTSVNNLGTTTNVYSDWKLTVTDANGKTKDLSKNAYGNLVRVDEHNAGNTYSTYYTYNYLGNLTKITDALNNIRNFTYDGLGRRLTAEDLHATPDATFGTYTYSYDDNGNLTQKIDPNSNTTNYTYDTLNRQLLEKLGTVTKVTNTYDTGTDGIGRLTGIITPTITQTNLYNSLGGLKSESKVINATTYTTSYDYDRQGNQILITNPDNSQVKYIYNTAGMLKSVLKKEAGSGSNSIFIPPASNPLIVKALLIGGGGGGGGGGLNVRGGGGGAGGYKYNASFLVTPQAYSITVGNGGAGGTEYHGGLAGGDSVFSTLIANGGGYGGVGDGGNGGSGGGGGFWNGSSGIGGIGSQGSNGGKSLIGYPAGGGGATGAGSDGTGTSTSGSGGAGIANSISGISVTYAGGGGGAGGPAGGVGGGGGAGAAGTANTGGGGSGSSSQVPGGNGGSGIVIIRYVTAELGPCTGGTITTDGPETVHTFISSGTFTVVSPSDPRPIPDPSDPGFAYVITNFDYSPASQPTAIYYGNGVVTTNTYDSNKLYRLNSKVSQKGTVHLQDLSYTYDPVGNITQIVDASTTDTAKTSNYTYDDLYRLTGATITNTGTPYTETYTYDAIGNILTKTGQGSYTYAGTGYANPHAATSIGSTNFTYDNNGNLTSAGTKTYAWDYNNRMTQITTGTKTISYDYDPTGQRIKYSNGSVTTYYPSKFYNIDNLGTVTKHIFANGIMVATITSSPPLGGTTPSCTPPATGDWTISTSCSFTGSAIAPASVIVNANKTLTLSPSSKLLIDLKHFKLLVKHNGGVLIKQTATLRQVKTTDTIATGNTIAYILTDHLGSTNVTTDTTGNILELSDYYPYGSLRTNTGSPKEQRKYIGEEYDADTSLSYLNARYYDGNRGQFISQDPSFLSLGDEQMTMQNTVKSLQEYLMDPQALNSYSYAENNPITKSDPNGKDAAVANSLLGAGVSLEAIGLGADSTIIGLPAGLVIGGVGAVILGIGGLVHYFSKSDSSKGKQDKPNVQPAPKPEDIQGKTPEEIGEMMKDKGWEKVDPSRNGGDRWQKPGTKGSDQVRIEKGNPNDYSNPTKQGPYGRISEQTPDGSKKSPPIPLKGNTTLKP